MDALEKGKAEAIAKIWQPPENWNVTGAWFWWFWLFFIHDENTEKTGKCRQLMILWSIKKDRKIKCNSLDIQIPSQIEKTEKGWVLNGAVAAWYFDGKEMRHDFVLEKSRMLLEAGRLSAPGSTPSEFFQEGEGFITKIKSGELEFEFCARQTDKNAAVGPTHGSSRLPFGMEIAGTRIETMELSGFETGKDGERKKIAGTAYFQKILVASPIPQWYWGLYHFKCGSFFTYMLPYLGKNALADNAWKGAKLGSPLISLNPDVLFYHAPTGRAFSGSKLSVKPEKIREEGSGLWRHLVKGGGKEFEITATAEAYSHSCWKFEKNVGVLPFKSTFRYNEYPAVANVEIVLKSGEKIRLENGWGSMENSWGFLI